MPMTLALPIGPVEAFVLVATRVLAVLATSPVMGLKSVPAQARIGLGLLVALIMVPVVAKDGLPAGVDVTWSAIAGEAVVGALAGFAATLVYAAIQLGAGLLDLQAGFSLGSLYDATFGNQGAVLERFYNALAALLFLQTDAHHLLITALSQLFVIVPLGGFQVSMVRPDLLAQIITSTFAVALELVFPVMAALLLADMALAILARVAPQFGLFSIGVQIKLALALGALIITIPLILPRVHALFGAVAGASVVVLR
jgi:flagellar biosynthesis protein FliR